ncbi:MAG: PQQ-binding-like beta-propeller repeat protein [Akkermansiaceae bacterium]|nr:PQQ-binding-like beta-propeller repeat protein [Akkermansiaceae bacterium]
MRMRGLSIIIIAATAAGAVAGNWPSYRGPGDQGHSDAGKLPTEWSESQNIAWKLPIKGKAWSSPVVWGDRIWVTNAPPEGTRGSVICVHRDTGKKLYEKRLFVNPAPQYCHPFNSYASPSAALEEGRVYVTFGAPFTGCLDMKTGEVLWERTDFECNHFRGAGSSPFIYKNLLILHFDGSDHQFVVAMDKNTGKTVWRTDRSVDYKDLDPETGKPKREGDMRKAFSTPVIMKVGGRDLLISQGSMALYAYEPETGKEVWRVELTGVHSGSTRPVTGHGLVYMPMGFGKGPLLAVRADGKGNVTDTHVEWKHTRVVPTKPSVLLSGDLLFMVDDGGIAACLDAKTGDEIWKERIGGNFSASPLLAGGNIYLFDEEGKATVIKAAREFKVVAENQLDAGCMGSPAASGEMLIIRTKEALYGIKE